MNISRNLTPTIRWGVLVVLTTLAGRLMADGLPLVQTLHTDFAGSGNCASCHSFLQDAAGQNVSIDTDWRSTMMANAAKDPLWQAKVSSEVHREPALQSVIEDKCATCHMPMARTQAKALGVEVSVFGTGFLNEANPFHGLAMDGVSCALCHQIADESLGEQAAFSGGYVIDTSTDSPNRLIYGPFPNPFTRQMQNNLGYTPVEGPHTANAGLCGTCHNLETPFVDASGAVLGTFPEQMTYTEWEHSQFNSTAPEGRTCQDCHMPTAEGGVVLSNRGAAGLQARSPFSKHFFVGGNAFMLSVLSDNLEELQITASSPQLEQTRLRLISQMQSATANLTVTDVRVGESELEVRLRVSSLVGHKFPSGFPSRRAWIHLTLKDKDGVTVFDSGRPDEGGRISGNDADFVAGTCEPHYRVITDPDQVQIYESIMQNTDGEVTYTLLRGAQYRKDNRLLPMGFPLASADPRIAVAGGAIEDTDFTGGQDDILYRIPTAGRVGPYSVDVSLLYQSVSAAFVADLQQDSTPQIDTFRQLFESADQTPVTVAALTFSVASSDPYSLNLAPLRFNHGPELVVTGPVSTAVTLEKSTDLQDWELIESFQQSANPSTFEDTLSGASPHLFYRLTWPAAWARETAQTFSKLSN